MTREKYKAFDKSKISDGELISLIARTVTATASINRITFSIEINTIWMKNAGEERIYYKFDDDATATEATEAYLEPGEAFAYDGRTNQLTYICDATKTSTLRIKVY